MITADSVATAEDAIVGCLALDPDTAATIMADLQPSDFASPRAAALFTAVRDLRDEHVAVDAVTILHRVQADPRGPLRGAEGREYVIGILDTPTLANVEHYIEIVRQGSSIRKLRAIAARIHEATEGHQPNPERVIADAEEMLREVAERGRQDSGLTTISGIVSRVVEQLSDSTATNRVPTGISDIDTLTNGVHAEGMTVIAARPHMGKTAFATTMLAHVARSERPGPAILFSLEMTREDATRNILADVSGVPLDDLQPGRVEWMNDEKHGRIAAAMSRMAKWNLVISDETGISPHRIRALVARTIRDQRAERPSIVVIDYLQLMDTSAVAGRNTNREREVSWLSGWCKRMAREFRCPFVILAQLNRSAESRTGNRPRMSDLRESGSLEQDADGVYLLFRPSYYDADDAVDEQEAEVIVAKNRSGRSGIAKCRFLGAYARWADAWSNDAY